MLTETHTHAILAMPQGLALMTSGMNLAIGAARRDLECELAEVQSDADHRWYDTEGGMFLGDNEGDQDFRAMTMESIAFLDQLGLLRRHPDHSNWVRYIDEQV